MGSNLAQLCLIILPFFENIYSMAILPYNLRFMYVSGISNRKTNIYLRIIPPFFPIFILPHFLFRRMKYNASSFVSWTLLISKKFLAYCILVLLLCIFTLYININWRCICLRVCNIRAASPSRKMKIITLTLKISKTICLVPTKHSTYKNFDVFQWLFKHLIWVAVE